MSEKKMNQNLLQNMKKNSLLRSQSILGHESSIDYYVTLAQKGQYPLFFKEWIENYRMTPKKINENTSREKLKKYFKRISHHHNIDRQKIALSTFSEKEINDFVRSFMGLVESHIKNHNEYIN